MRELRAFAATGALESYILIKDNRPGQNDNRAEQILVSCSDAGISCQQGGYIDSAAEYLSITGLPAESYFPYTATDAPCSNAQTGWENYTYRTYSWDWVTWNATSADPIKSALYNNGPLITTMDVYRDFYYYSKGVYQYAWGEYRGGHAVVIVGYADNATISGGGYFIVKNSWGTGWGESGYFKIAYSEIGSATNFGDYTIAYQEPPVLPPATPGSLTATAASSSRRTSLLG